MDAKEISQLVDILTTLSNKADNWDNLIKFFENDKYLNKYYKEFKEECNRETYFGKTNAMIMTIKKLLEEIEVSKQN